jgi:CheY-like chemotaxis protein
MNQEAGKAVAPKLEHLKLVSAKLDSKLKSVRLQNLESESALERRSDGEQLATLNEAPGQSVAPDEQGGETKMHVLLVEDESLIAEIIGEALTDAGHAVHSVSTARDALAHLSSGSRVDILFTDINLPDDEMDGAALAERARKSSPGLPVIYASGRWGRLEELRSVPNARILQKPYSPARACEAVEFLIAAKLEAGGARDTRPSEELALAL